MFSNPIGHADVLIWFVEIFFFVVWFWLLMSIVSDLFRDHEASGVTKALWVVLVFFFPVIGILAYLIIRGGGMAQRAARMQQQAQERFDAYVRSVAGESGPADQIQKAKALLDSGAIDKTEFERLKAKALS
ncbi:MAG: SHOCT domain-containing protein [Candidatus Binatia bacterium]